MKESLVHWKFLQYPGKIENYPSSKCMKKTIKLAYVLLVLFICERIYTPTGKREDLWGISCKETQSV